jgi:PAS domain S-box-containing protein
MASELINEEGNVSLRNEAERLLDRRLKDRRTKADVLLSKSGADLASMSKTDIEKLLFDLQVHQIELELQNEELKRAHEELSVSRDDFARIFNLSPVAFLALNEQGIINKANIAAAQLLGCSIEELAGRKLGKFIHPSDQDKFYFFIHDLVMKKNNQILNAMLAANNSASISLECQGHLQLGCSRSLCSHNNSQPAYVELRGAVHCNYQDDIQICLAIQDVTEYKRSEAVISCLNEKLEQKVFEQTSALIESNLDLNKKIEELKISRNLLLEEEAKLNAIFNASIEGIITIDTSGTMLSINTAVAKIFGYGEKELIGSSYQKLMAPTQSKMKGQDVRSYLQARAPNIHGLIREVDGMRKDGTIVPLDISLVEFSINGTSYFTAIVRDVSLRKQQEQQEKEHLDELAHVARLCLIGEMGSGIAHEVNQPLTAIANYSQACLRFIGAESIDLEQLGDILFKLHQQALKAGRIIHRMKDFVSPRKIYRTNTDINTLVEDAVNLCASDFKHNNIKLELDLATNLPVVTVDDVQIEQVLLNLLRNSIDAFKGMPQKSQRQVLIQTRFKNLKKIVVTVKDNGSGIDEAHKEKILAPFFTTKSTGMGMGLSISRSIIEAHSGVLNFNSNTDEGATFYFSLPVQRTSK